MPASEHHRLDLTHTACELFRQGFNKGQAGSASVRHGSGFLVTPLGVPACDMFPTDVVAVEMGGRAHGNHPPSREWRLHHDIYARRPEINAVLQTRALFSVVLSCVGRGIPPFHYMVTAAGGKTIRCASYAAVDSQELSDNVLAALSDRKACLVAQYGLIALGDSLNAALRLVVEVEELAEQYWHALQVGEPDLLPETEIARILETR